MAMFMKKLSDFNLWIERAADPRLDGWYLMQSPLPVIAITLLYLLIVFLGPKLMEKREAFNLKFIIIPYNFLMVIWSSYVVYEVSMSAYLASYSLSCQPVDYSNDPLAIRMLNAMYLFWTSKVVELADTVFFILRKKNNQVTFLHWYHHSTMVVQCWISLRFIPGGHRFLIPLLNSFIHVFMYSYYALAAFGPHMQKYLWWKRYLTKMQLAQFVLIISHDTIRLTQDCDFPWGHSFNSIIYTSSFFVLFSLFYIKAYLKPSKPAPKSSIANGKHD